MATSSGSVAVSGTTLEADGSGATQGPAQPLGGALGSSVSYNAILSTPLAAGATGNYSFRVTVVKAGNFLVAFNIEALPNP